MNSKKYEQRTAIYKMPAEAARTMYKTRSAHDKDVPFLKYILNCINNESGLLYPVDKVELT